MSTSRVSRNKHRLRVRPARRARQYPAKPSPAKNNRAKGPKTQPSRATVAKMHRRSGSKGAVDSFTCGAGTGAPGMPCGTAGVLMASPP